MLLISRDFLSQVLYYVEFTNILNHDVAGKGVKKLQINCQVRLFGSLFLIFSCQDGSTEFGLVGGLIVSANHRNWRDAVLCTVGGNQARLDARSEFEILVCSLKGGWKLVPHSFATFTMHSWWQSSEIKCSYRIWNLAALAKGGEASHAHDCTGCIRNKQP